MEVGSDVFTINAPIFTSPDGAIKAGSEIFVLKFDVTADEESDEKPKAKRLRTSKPAAKSKGKARGKR